jgi:uncharacterized protein HemX
LLKEARMWPKIFSWANANRLVAVIIVVFGILALASAADSWRQRRTAEGYLQAGKEQTEQLQRLLDNTMTQYQDKIRDLEARVAAADRREAAARKRLDEARAAAGRPFVPPAGPGETVDRFGKLGYRGRVK